MSSTQQELLPSETGMKNMYIYEDVTKMFSSAKKELLNSLICAHLFRSRGYDTGMRKSLKQG